MDINGFDELVGRIDGLAWAVVLLAEMMEQETDMDGPTLSRQWRQAVVLGTAHTTLQGLAQTLDDARSRAQEARSAALLAADPERQQKMLTAHQPVGQRQLDALGHRLTQAEHRLDRLDGTTPSRPRTPRGKP